MAAGSNFEKCAMRNVAALAGLSSLSTFRNCPMRDCFDAVVCAVRLAVLPTATGASFRTGACGGLIGDVADAREFTDVAPVPHKGMCARQTPAKRMPM
jgi:hypothetical protein